MLPTPRRASASSPAAAHLDVMEASDGWTCLVANPGRSRRALLQGGTGVPTGARRMLDFTQGLSEILVVEEKAPWWKTSCAPCYTTTPFRAPGPARPTSTIIRCCRPWVNCVHRGSCRYWPIGWHATSLALDRRTGAHFRGTGHALERGRYGQPHALLLCGMPAQPVDACPRF